MLKSRVPLLLLLSAAAAGMPAEARTCPEQGRLNFVGLSRGGTRSVWLSSTIAGNFRLDVSASGQTVESWSRASPGIRVSESPVVAEDSSGAHKLVGQEGPVPCDVSEQLQSNQGGGLLPPGINWPSARPKPPIGISLRPEHPIAVAIRPRPPVGIVVKPSQPIGVAVRPEQPIGVAVRPEQPVGVAVRPEQPVGVAVRPEQPVGVVAPGEPLAASSGATAARTNCLDPADPAAYDLAGRPIAQLCPRLAPLTEARDSLAPTAWNLWADINHGYVRDSRSGLEGRAFIDRMTVGVDRLLLPDLAIGASAAIEVGRSTSRDDLLDLASDGVEFGPYLVWRIADGLVVDVAYSYASADNTVRVGPFRGGYNASRHQLSATLSGQLLFGIGYARPSVTATHGWADVAGHRLHAELFGQPLAVDVPRRRLQTGTASLGTEVGAIFSQARGGYVAPWAELGLSYAYQRPEEADEFLLGRTDELVGTVRAGLRLALSPTSILELGGGYLSLGQSGLDSWEARALVSFGF